MATPVPAASNPMRPVLPPRGVAVVKSVLSGDTAVLIGRAPAPGARVPEVIFTFERVTAPRYDVSYFSLVSWIFLPNV